MSIAPRRGSTSLRQQVEQNVVHHRRQGHGVGHRMDFGDAELL